MLAIRKCFANLIPKTLNIKLFYSYIHLDNHNKRINQRRRDLSYDNPKYIHNNQKSPPYQAKLSKKAREYLQKIQFKQYRDQLILTQDNVEQQKIPDPIWGDQPAPKHYAENLSARKYYKIQPFSKQKQNYPEHKLFNPSLDLPFEQTQTKSDLQKKFTPSHLLQVALKARKNRVINRKFWHQLQMALNNKYNSFTTLQLIQIKRAFAGKPRFGQPQFHKILNDLINSQLKLLKAQQLLAAFCSYANQNNTQHQDNVLQLLLKQSIIQNFNGKQETALEFLNLYAYYRVPQYHRKLQQRYINQRQTEGHKIIKLLNINNHILKMNLQQSFLLLKLLFKLKISNVGQLLFPITKLIQSNLQNLNPTQLFQFINYLTKVQNGEGFLTTELAQKLKPKLLQNWTFYNDHQKLQILYSFWNINKFKKDLKSLYAQIPIAPQPNLLYYFVQIQLMDSTNRQLEIMKGLSQLQIFPLPYYYKYKQFVTVMLQKNKKWFIPYFIQKMQQTQVHYNVARHMDNYLLNPQVIQLGKLLNTIQNLKFNPMIEVQNIQMVQFAVDQQRIAVQVIPDRAIINGKQSDGIQTLKRSYKARSKVLESLGWSIIQINWKTFKLKARQQQYELLSKALSKALQRQRVLELEQRKQKIKTIRQISVQRKMNGWNYKDFEMIFNELDEDGEKIVIPDEIMQRINSDDPIRKQKIQKGQN